jgi:hypothetical protein
MNKTIIYYTSNREKPEFEKKIQDNILAQCGNLPIISVSQKPIKFGKNICIGNLGHSYEAEFLQVKIGAEAAQTDYLIFTEADFLYPKEYFEFEPMGDIAYRNENVWVIFAYKKPRSRILPRYYWKPFSLGTQICRRDYILKNGFSEHTPYTHYKTKIACVSFKTGDSMSNSNVVGERKLELPYWGDARSLTNKYL